MRFVLVFVLALFTASVAAHPGVGVVVDRHGNVFYTDLKHVWKVDPQGRKSIAVHNVHTHELFLDRDGNLYGEHLWYEGDRTKKWGYRVWRLSAAGELSDVIPATVGFRSSYSFVRDQAGNMYWAGPPDCAPSGTGQAAALCITFPDGHIKTLAPASQFTDIRWIAAAPNGTVYLVDAGKLRRVSPDGMVTTIGGNLIQRSVYGMIFGNRHALMGLFPDSNGDIYLANANAGLIQKIAPNGTVSTFWKAALPYSPTGVTVTPTEVVVLEYAGNGARIRRLRRDGSEKKP